MGESDGHQTILVDRKRLLDLIEARIASGDDREDVFKKIPKPFRLGYAVNSESEESNPVIT